MHDLRIEAAAIALYDTTWDLNGAAFDESTHSLQEYFRKAATAALDAADKAATITEPYLLTECPSGTVVIDDEGITVCRDTPGTWMEFGTEERFHSRDITLPARVIHWGSDV